MLIITKYKYMTRFQEYFEELIKKFNEYHSNLLKETTEEDIHKIRTTLKKLRTFNILLDGLLFREKDFPSDLKNLFKSSGEIRDIQIQLNILKDYEDEYKNYLLEKYKSKLSEFKIKDSYDKDLQYLGDKLDKVEDYHIDEQIISNIKTRIEINLDETREMFSNVSAENLHDIRTKIKRSYYTRLMLGIKDNIELLDDMQETIGSWHDLDVTIQHINDFNNKSDIVKILLDKRDNFFNSSIELLKKL